MQNKISKVWFSFYVNFDIYLIYHLLLKKRILKEVREECNASDTSESDGDESEEEMTFYGIPSKHCKPLFTLDLS